MNVLRHGVAVVLAIVPCVLIAQHVPKELPRAAGGQLVDVKTGGRLSSQLRRHVHGGREGPRFQGRLVSAAMRNVECLVESHWPGRQAFGKSHPFDELQDKRRDSVRVGDAVNRGNQRVVERGEEPRLTTEPRDPLDVVGEGSSDPRDRRRTYETASFDICLHTYV
jgi:hypothetical protein